MKGPLCEQFEVLFSNLQCLPMHVAQKKRYNTSRRRRAANISVAKDHGYTVNQRCRALQLVEPRQKSMEKITKSLRLLLYGVTKSGISDIRPIKCLDISSF